MLQSLQKILRPLLTSLFVLVFCGACSFLPTIEHSPWTLVSLPTDATVLDLSFVSKDHGWLTGTRSTLMETFDGGETWEPRTLELGDVAYRLNSISFDGDEGWIAGEPSLLLHTEDAGKSWSSVPLSAKLPGKPAKVFAAGLHTAEMTTDVGAIYRTEDSGRHWTAMVQEAFGVLRNVNRAPNGTYVAVSSRGSFYSIWKPGEVSWEPHNRNSSRRVQNMGFTPDNQLWMLARGGQIQFSNDSNEWEDPLTPERSVSVGLLDLAYRTPEELWVTGGSGNLLCSFDGGKTWQKDPSVSKLGSNLYRVIFQTPEQGFVLGQSGVLLRYNS